MSICILGLQGCGKSSIIKVLFEKMGPKKTCNLLPTSSIEKKKVIVGANEFEIIDFPGSFLDGSEIDDDSKKCLKNCKAIVACNLNQEDINQYEGPFKHIETVFKNLEEIRGDSLPMFFVFFHKNDIELGLSQEKKFNCIREIRKVINDYSKNTFKNKSISLSDYTTSIYEENLINAFSKVVQNCHPLNNNLTVMIENLISKSNLDKAIIMDIEHKLIVATDVSPNELSTMSLAIDTVDILINLSYTYDSDFRKNKEIKDDSLISITLQDKTIIIMRGLKKLSFGELGKWR